jgi:hypothetical protein
MKKQLIIFLALGSFACNPTPDEKVAKGDWITGTEEEIILTIEEQFRGFDMAMVETGYRYKELYRAGEDENWEYAGYQAEHIQVAIENGLQRRPARAPSAENFLNDVLPGMQTAINLEDKAEFDRNFQLLTTACNSCHTLEEVPFFKVVIPTHWQSVIGK